METTLEVTAYNPKTKDYSGPPSQTNNNTVFFSEKEFKKFMEGIDFDYEIKDNTIISNYTVDEDGISDINGTYLADIIINISKFESVDNFQLNPN